MRAGLGLVSAQRAIACYWLTSGVVILGLALGQAFHSEPAGFLHLFRYDPSEVYANWDGQWYKEIAAKGYTYARYGQSSVAFFPAYPLVGRAVALVSGLDVGSSLVVVSNLCFVLALGVFHQYLGEAEPRAGLLSGGYALLCLGLMPNAFFFRVAYSESLLLLLTAVALLAMEREWPLGAIAVVIGLATATRPVGVGLVPGFLLHAWRRAPATGSLPRGLVLAGLLPLSCWGLLAYLAYLGWWIGDPLAFARTQEFWSDRPPASWPLKTLALAVAEPVWSTVVPGSSGFLGKVSPLTTRFTDPFFFVAAVALTALGARRGWVTTQNTICSSMYLLIPYVTKGYEYDLGGMGRFATLALSTYVVLGRLLASAPGPIVGGVFGLSGALLVVYSAMFASWK
jgi:Gpi18-like mannosyltransferase